MTAGRLRSGVVGASGYAGAELARLLFRHPRLDTPLLFRRPGGEAEPEDGDQGVPGPGGRSAPALEPFSWSTLRQRGVDLLFLATPPGASRALVPEAVDKGLRVVDLSGAWRLKEERHRSVYRFPADDPRAAALAETAAYGLPELNRERISGTTLVANPGCYATSVILALAPLVRAGAVDLDRGIIADSKSGVSGAGKEPTPRTHFVSVADNLSAYAIFGHRHVGEVLEQLDLAGEAFTFTPHLLPIPRGILSTVYVRLSRVMSAAEVHGCLRDFYEGAPWVRVFPPPRLPEIQHSLHTNYCDIGFGLADDGRRLVIVSCLDNLMKGAAGQAVQNMNVMYGWGDEEGLN